MDKITLSKHKYIYSLYINSKNEVHAERLKVAYINKNFVYFIGGGDCELSMARLDNVFENLNDFAERGHVDNFLGTIYNRELVWDICGEEVNFETIRKKQRQTAVEKEINAKKQKIDNMKRAIQAEKKAIAALQKVVYLKE